MFKDQAAALTLMTMVAMPSAASSQGAGGPGCTNLPEYHRALGALQGMTSACDMSVEEARRVVAAHDGRAVAEPRATPRPRTHPRRHGKRRGVR